MSIGEIHKLKIITEKNDEHQIPWFIISLIVLYPHIFIEIRNIYFDRYYETVISFSSILGEYLNSVKLDYMSC